MSEELSRHEKAALLDIGRWGTDSPFYWREKSMPKLAARGLVEPHPKVKSGWKITEAGCALVERWKQDDEETTAAQ